MNCVYCKRNLNAIGQDNMSVTPGRPVCEDCDREIVRAA